MLRFPSIECLFKFQERSKPATNLEAGYVWPSLPCYQALSSISLIGQIEHDCTDD
ncbi:hypothetical protein T09_10514 [Trichinella sp. T9]|nr:hypothetical protein T09_10514 [Trichinella sp. T9]